MADESGKQWENVRLAQARERLTQELNRQAAEELDKLEARPNRQYTGWALDPLVNAYLVNLRKLANKWLRLRRKIAKEDARWATKKELEALTSGMRDFVEQYRKGFVSMCVAAGLERVSPDAVEAKANTLTCRAEKIWSHVAMECKALNREIAPRPFGVLFREARRAVGDKVQDAAADVKVDNRKTIQRWEGLESLPQSGAAREAKRYISKHHPDGEKVLLRLLWTTDRES